ncbi:hypothetical protein BDZ45DRAFT_681808 [Acephala macrosclerotiorum]|nr:hypothetical protein BDZ45DRAFT_681808 [Acephala macrosclerotiorum]
MPDYAAIVSQYVIPTALRAEIQLSIERAVRETVSTAFMKLFDRPVVELPSNPLELLIESQSLPEAATQPQQQPQRQPQRQRRQRRHRSSRQSAKLSTVELIEPAVESIALVALSGPLLAPITDVTACRCRMQLRPPYHFSSASKHRFPALRSLIF